MEAEQRTPDGRYIVVDGRRWRASDPSIPEKLRQELVDELMAARRAVRTDSDSARPRVSDAKHALGERGYPWWEEPDEAELAVRIVATTRALLTKRAGRSICPSDVARVVGGAGERWRAAMPAVRSTIAELAAAGTVIVTQKGHVVDIESARGPVRISFPPAPGQQQPANR
jgi:hypothetical protein